MDLRGKLSPAQIERACSVLDYQPFIITDDIQTGAAYSWMYGVNVASPALVFERRDFPQEEWERITDANARLRRMYEGFVEEIARRYPGGSLLDFGCNNGYFPVKAESCRMKGIGCDAGPQYRDSIALLNDVFGTQAEFVHTSYDVRRRSAPIEGQYTVVCASAMIGNLPDPLNFLSFLGSLATDAIFLLCQVIETDALLVSYLAPHPALGPTELPFPLRFNNNTRLSRGLLYHGFEEMGFKRIDEIPWSDDWLLPYYNANYRPPPLDSEDRPEVQQAWTLLNELNKGSVHRAIIAAR
jgi:SAM-dependent methyltransferase